MNNGIGLALDFCFYLLWHQLSEIPASLHLLSHPSMTCSPHFEVQNTRFKSSKRARPKIPVTLLLKFKAEP